MDDLLFSVWCIFLHFFNRIDEDPVVKFKYFLGVFQQSEVFSDQLVRFFWHIASCNWFCNHCVAFAIRFLQGSWILQICIGIIYSRRYSRNYCFNVLFQDRLVPVYLLWFSSSDNCTV